MKAVLLISTLAGQLAFAQYGAGFAEEESHTEHNNELEEGHEHARPFTPEEEEVYFTPFENGVLRKRRFAYTYWNECSQPLSGNYLGYNCTSKRRLSQILFEFMEDHLERCVEEAASDLGINMESFHITHKGIYGDRRHSSRSLHAEGRAIDIHSIKIKGADGEVMDLPYKNYPKGKFYTRLRFCWGGAVSQYNGCPLYNGMPGRTGSIGHENRNHRVHLHLSVPYCVSGQYAGIYYRR